MNLFLYVLSLLWTVVSVNCVNYPQTPAGFTYLDNYGTEFATRKTYFRSTATTVGNSQQVICNAAGLMTLSLDSLEEFQYLVAMMRFKNVGGWMGAVGTLNYFYWMSSGGWINYQMLWAPNYPSQESGRNCLQLYGNGVVNNLCNTGPTTCLCQKVGP